MATYNKKDLQKEIKRVMEDEHGIKAYQKDINLITDLFLELIEQHVSNGDTVTINGFARITTAPVKSFQGRDLVNHESVEVQSYKRVCFKTGAEFKRRVNGEDINE